ncbi:MAG: FtsX-like permease family protein [Bacteroidales bacterium]
MNFPFYIARRYLMAKKSHNAINIISIISVMGVTVGTMALVIILSVFNGFDGLVRSLINSFNPDLKIELTDGRAFITPEETLQQLRDVAGVYDLSLVLEDKALVRYDELQTIAVVKGVEENYAAITGLDSMIVEGSFRLKLHGEPYALIGRGIRIYLNVMLLSPRQISFYAPRRAADISFDANRALNRKYLSVAGVFSVEQDYDLNYIIVPVDFARQLFEYENNEANRIEVKLKPGAASGKVKAAVSGILGDDYRVLDRYQQNEVFYKTMKAEKWAIFLILVFILIIASFNVIGTLTMLMLEKKNDMITLNNLGADNQTLKRIFFFEGWMITATGALLGTLLGLVVCWIQIRYGLIRLQGSGSFIIDAYPVVVKPLDIAVTFAAVIVIGLFAAWYPIRYFTKTHLGAMQ